MLTLQQTMVVWVADVSGYISIWDAQVISLHYICFVECNDVLLIDTSKMHSISDSPAKLCSKDDFAQQFYLDGRWKRYRCCKFAGMTFDHIANGNEKYIYDRLSK